MFLSVLPPQGILSLRLAEEIFLYHLYLCGPHKENVLARQINKLIWYIYPLAFLVGGIAVFVHNHLVSDGSGSGSVLGL
jgi:hypothetical protein